MVIDFCSWDLSFPKKDFRNFWAALSSKYFSKVSSAIFKIQNITFYLLVKALRWHRNGILLIEFFKNREYSGVTTVRGFYV